MQGKSGSLVLNMALSFLSGRQFAPAFCLSRQTHSFLQQTSEPLLQCQTVHRPGWRCKDNRSYLPAHLLTGVILDGPQWTTSSIVLRAQLSTLLQETSLLQLQGRTVRGQPGEATMAWTMKDECIFAQGRGWGVGWGVASRLWDHVPGSGMEKMSTW